MPRDPPCCTSHLTSEVLNNLEITGTFDRTGLAEGPLERAFIVKFTRQLDLGR